MAMLINGQPAAKLGCSGMVIRLADQAESTCTLTFAGATTLPIEPGARVTVQADGLTFVGTAHNPERNARGGRREPRIVIRDDWGKLADTTIQASPTLAAEAIARDCRVALAGQYVAYTPAEPGSGEAAFALVPMAVKAWITKVLADQAEFTIDGAAWAGGVQLPPAEAEAVKIAEAIKACVRWFPGAVATVAGQDARLTLRRASEMPSLVIPWSTQDGYELTERRDLILAGVSLWLRKEVSSNLATKTELQRLTAGSESGPNVYVAAIDLLPERHQLAQAELELISIQAGQRSFWQKLLPGKFEALPQLDTATLIGSGVTKEFPELDHAVLKGQLPAEFASGCSGPFAKWAKVYTVGNNVAAKVGRCRAAAVFEFTLGDRTVRVPLEADFTGTNLNDGAGTVTRFIREDKRAADAGEAFADFANLAAQIYADGQRLAYAGRASWRVASIPAATSLIGTAVQFSGGGPGAINSPVYGVSIDCFNRRITAEFGPNGYLAAQDRVALERAKRNWRRPRRRLSREDGSERPEETPGADPAPQQPQQPQQTPAETISAPDYLAIVLTRGGTPEAPTYSATVQDARLLAKRAPQELIEVTGLGSSVNVPVGTTRFWLEVTLTYLGSSLLPTFSCALRWDGGPDTFTPLSDPWESGSIVQDNGEPPETRKQTKARKMIGRVVYGFGAQPVVEQDVRGALAMDVLPFLGRGAWYPMPL